MQKYWPAPALARVEQVTAESGGRIIPGSNVSQLRLPPTRAIAPSPAARSRMPPDANGLTQS